MKHFMKSFVAGDLGTTAGGFSQDLNKAYRTQPIAQNQFDMNQTRNTEPLGIPVPPSVSGGYDIEDVRQVYESPKKELVVKKLDSQNFN